MFKLVHFTVKVWLYKRSFTLSVMRFARFENVPDAIFLLRCSVKAEVCFFFFFHRQCLTWVWCQRCLGVCRGEPGGNQGVHWHQQGLAQIDPESLISLFPTGGLTWAATKYSWSDLCPSHRITPHSSAVSYTSGATSNSSPYLKYLR